MDALVIGAGPAGLMAADVLSAGGVSVTVAEAKPSPARKFLMAGKSGLNLTKAEAFEGFLAHYEEAADWLRPMIADLDPAGVQDWARSLGQEVFTGSSGRVFPVAMKASPLLRAWLRRLDGQGVTLRTGWRWTGFDGDALRFEGDAASLRPAVTVLALGGASWARLGSDGAWVQWLTEKGVEVAPFAPANMGFVVDWSPHMARWFGAPVKGVALSAGDRRHRGEFVVSARGVEGGGIYALARQMRDGAVLHLDLLPDLPEPEIARRIAGKSSQSITNHLRRKLGLDGVKLALLQEFGRPLPQGQALARLLKRLPLRHAGPRPMDEAISTAGGIRRSALTPALELRALPGIFACGEMLDWEAPTGGYLLTACLATGRHAGRAALRRLREGPT
ncbi:TIGR03862 family flavoprotein [Halodurantibacterium flavum]|uniref:TIGR03862 family flavoprotein n=1 Tax=Halodurantibacterium flavum TaxID=1382802 RepID=A0ABW4S8B1_9RHOB